MVGVHGRPGMAREARRMEKDGPIIASITNLILQPTAFSAVR